MKSGGELKVLAQLIAEERRAPQPDRDWARLEAGIRRRLSEPAAPQPARFTPRLLLGLALAAALPLAWMALRRPETTTATHRPPAHAGVASAAPALAGKALAGASSLRATAQAVHVDHAGRAHWTLEPGSSARVRRDDTPIVIELESGSLSASVEPGQAPESFVVEAGEVRVAVHGTKFRVARWSDAVDVQVSEGVVSVTSRAAPDPVLLSASSNHRFVTAPATSEHPSARVVKTPASSPAALSREPSISDVEAAVGRIQYATQSCFARYTMAPEGVQVSARSTVSLVVRPDGGVTIRAFDPPLAPSVEACARSALATLRSAASQRGLELSRTLELGR